MTCRWCGHADAGHQTGGYQGPNRWAWHEWRLCPPVHNVWPEHPTD